MQKNVAGQKWIVYAWNITTHAPVTGDAANITANLRLDGGGANATDDVNPTELEDGYYIFDISQAESNADLILITPASSTGNVQVDGAPKSVYTTPPHISVADILTTQMSEAYAADGVAPTLAQCLFLIQQTIGDFVVSGTTLTAKKLDGSTTAATYTLDDASNPTSRTRAT